MWSSYVTSAIIIIGSGVETPLTLSTSGVDWQAGSSLSTPPKAREVKPGVGLSVGASPEGVKKLLTYSLDKYSFE
jgi:hypothetical protein